MLLIPADAVGPEIEIGWRLLPEAWGRGIATEAARPVLAHGFAGLRLPELVAEIDAGNAGSLRVAEKLGMQPGCRVEQPGRIAIRYTLTLAEFEAREAAS